MRSLPRLLLIAVVAAAPISAPAGQMAAQAAQAPPTAPTVLAQRPDPAVGPMTRDEATQAGRHFAFAPAKAAPIPPRRTSPQVATASGPLQREVLGFAPYWLLASNGSWNYSLLSTVAYFGLTVNGDGSFVAGSDPGWGGWNSQDLANVISAAHAAGDRVVLVIKQPSNAAIIQLGTTPAGQVAITNTINAIASKNLDGVNVDFEGTGAPGVQAAFTNFVSQLSNAVHGHPGWTLSVDTYGSSASSDAGIYKIGDLAPLVDAIFVMAYDMVYSTTQAGPNAPLTGGGKYTYNDTTIVGQYLAKAPAGKIILGVPYYGYKWSTLSNQPNATTTTSRVAEAYSDILLDLSCGAQQQSRNWDTIAQSPWAAWWSPPSGDPCGGNHNSWRELYYDDATSLGFKYDLVNQNNLRGTGMWALGHDGTSPDFWNELALKFVPPSGVTAIAGDTEATITWARPTGADRDRVTSYTVTASPGGRTRTVGPIIPAATITGLINGTSYTFTVSVTTAGGGGPPSLASNPVTPNPVAKGPAVAVLPAVMNGAYGGYLTAAYVQDVGSSAANVRVQYFDPSGNPIGLGNSIGGLPSHGTWTLRQDNLDGLAAGQAGSAIVYSDQPLAVFVNEFAPGNHADASGYTGIPVPGGVGSTLYAPAIANGAYGGYTTGIGLLNAGTTPTDVRITYRDGAGSAITTQTLSAVPPGAYRGLYSGNSGAATDANLPAGFAGTATIESLAAPPQPLAAIVNETGPGNRFSSYDAVPGGSTTLTAPAALNNAYGGYHTGMAIQNTGATGGTVTLTYVDQAGSPTVKTFPIAGNGYLGIYQGTPADGPPPSATGYTAVLSSTVPIAAIVNEVAPAGTAQSTAYNTFAGGLGTVRLPLVENAGSDGWNTGLGVMNTGSSATTVTLTYYDVSTGSAVGTPQTQLVQPKAFWGPYQPQAGLPAGTRASAVLSTSSGGTIAVICNESNATSFMSYDGQ